MKDDFLPNLFQTGSRRAKNPYRIGALVVSEGGLEPPRPFGHQLLRLARLPIPPLRRGSGSPRIGGQSTGQTTAPRQMAPPGRWSPPTSMVHDHHTSDIQSERRDSTTLITFVNPEAFNALTPRMINDLVIVLREAAADRTCRAVVLTGRGARERALN